MKKYLIAALALVACAAPSFACGFVGSSAFVGYAQPAFVQAYAFAPSVSYAAAPCVQTEAAVVAAPYAAPAFAAAPFVSSYGVGSFGVSSYGVGFNSFAVNSYGLNSNVFVGRRAFFGSNVVDVRIGRRSFFGERGVRNARSVTRTRTVTRRRR